MFAGPAPRTSIARSHRFDLTPNLTLADKFNKWVPELTWRTVGSDDASDRFDVCGSNLPTGEWVQVRWHRFDGEYIVLIFPPQHVEKRQPVAGTEGPDPRACVVDALAQWQGSEGILETLYRKVPPTTHMMSLGLRLFVWVWWIIIPLFIRESFITHDPTASFPWESVIYAAIAMIYAITASIMYFRANNAREVKLIGARESFNRLVLTAVGAKTVDDIPHPAQAGALALVDEEKAARLARMMELAEAGGIVSPAPHTTMQDEEMASPPSTPSSPISRHEDPWSPETRQAAMALGKQMLEPENEGLPSRCKPSPKPVPHRPRNPACHSTI